MKKLLTISIILFVAAVFSACNPKKEPTRISGIYEIRVTQNGEERTVYTDGNYIIVGNFLNIEFKDSDLPPKGLTPIEVKYRLRDLGYPFTVQQVLSSQIKGLYEIHVSDRGVYRVFYTDGTHIIAGDIHSKDGKRNFTREKMDEKRLQINTTAALTVKYGNGEKEVIEVTIPTCPFCATADTMFEDANATKKVLFLPLSFQPEGPAIAEHILCSDDPAEEYKLVMKHAYTYFNTENHGFAKRGEQVKHLQAQVPGLQLKSCESGKKQLSEMEKAIAEVGITGVPMFIIDGKLIRGADPVIKDMVK